MPPKLIDSISCYKKNMNNPPCIEQCPRCLGENTTFKQHDSRNREVRYCFDFLVKTFIIRLFRWKCNVCKQKFTFHPDFLLPYKRFITPTILDLCHKYLSSEETSYRSVAHPEGSHYTYKGSTQEFSHASLWNWFQGLSSFVRHDQKTIQLPFQKVLPYCLLHHEVIVINPRKYRSEQRMHCLKDVQLLLHSVKYSGQLNLNVT